jgi:hypothetical protein
METERAQSEFNMAVSYLNRLNLLFYMADSAALDLDAGQWFHNLLALYRELSTEITDKEQEIFLEKIRKVNTLLVSHNIEYSRTQQRQIKPSLYETLQDFEINLRRILKSAGLQQKMMDDARNALR